MDNLLRLVCPEPKLHKYPIAYLYHGLRLWGKEARFPSLNFVNPIVEESGWCQSAFDALRDNDAYRRLVDPVGKPLLTLSEFGVRVLTTKDLGYGTEWKSAHPGAYEQVMAELGVPSSLELRVKDRGDARLVNLIQDSARRVHRDIECEWSAISLGMYLASHRWKNRFGEWVDFDMLADWLMSKVPGQGACYGTHVPYAMTLLHRLGREGKQALSSKIVAKLDRTLVERTSLLAKALSPNGTWDAKWGKYITTKNEAVLHKHRDLVRVICTGHHLEWMSYRPCKSRIPESLLRKVVLFLASALPEFEAALRADWFLQLPLSHAVRAICNLHGVIPRSVS